MQIGNILLLKTVPMFTHSRNSKNYYEYQLFVYLPFLYTIELMPQIKINVYLDTLVSLRKLHTN